MLAALLPLLGSILGPVMKNLFPDPVEAQKAQNAITLALIANSQQIQQAASDIVLAEAKSEHWLTSTWRPIVMLVFTGLIVARWFGISAPGLSQPEVLELWAIVKLGLGGYVIGRSAEKIGGPIVSAMVQPKPAAPPAPVTIVQSPPFAQTSQGNG